MSDSQVNFKLADGTYSVQYKVGDKFVFTGDFDSAYSEATEDELLGVYELVLDDESSCPRFRSEVSGRSYYEEWRLFSKYSPAQTNVETEPTELEEALAKIESLESALEDAVRELTQKDAEIQILKEVHRYNETLIKKLVTGEYNQ